MQFEDVDEDEPAVPGDVLATSQEIEAQARCVYLDEEKRSRLLKSSIFILGMNTRLKRRCQPEDLLQEALVAVLSGRRTWKKNRVDFVGLLLGTMKSLASSHEASLKTKDSHVLVEGDFLTELEQGDAAGVVENFGDSGGSPEVAMLDDEHDAQIAGVFAIIRAKFDQDDLAGRIVEMMAERKGYMPIDIRKALGVSEREFWSAYRRVTRVLVDFREKGAIE